MMMSSMNASIRFGYKSSGLSSRDASHFQANDKTHFSRVPFSEEATKETSSRFASGSATTPHTARSSSDLYNRQFLMQIDEETHWIRTHGPDSHRTQSRKYLSDAEPWWEMSLRATNTQDALLDDADHVWRGNPLGRGPWINGFMSTERDECTCGKIARLSPWRGECHSVVGINQAWQHSPMSSTIATTLMICNLPCSFSTARLAKFVEKLGFAELYVDTHVPRGKRNSLGYGFVEFVDPSVASQFVVAIEDVTFGHGKKPYCKPAVYQSAGPIYL